MFCLPQSTASCSWRSPGRSTCERSESSAREAAFCGQLAAGVAQRAGELAARLAQALVRAGERDPHVSRSRGLTVTR